MNTTFLLLRKHCHAAWLLPLLPILLLTGGCGGFSATKSISPLDFLLPGLHMKADPPQPLLPDGTNALVCWHNGAPQPRGNLAQTAATHDPTWTAVP